jgi:hypothetical protein
MCATGPDFASAAKSERDMIGRFQRQIQLRVAAFLTTYWAIFSQFVNLPERVSFGEGGINPSITHPAKRADTLGNGHTQEEIIRRVTQPATASAMVVTSINSARDISRSQDEEQRNREQKEGFHPRKIC